MVGEVGAQALFVLRGDFGGTARAGAFLFRQPYFAAVVVELLHRAGFFVGDGVRGHDGFDVVAGGEVGFDAGAGDGGEGAGHGCWSWLLMLIMGGSFLGSLEWSIVGFTYDR